ncbi:hypothetical protein LMH87_009550 [Akanthomyces muscarius]|uniref:Uncharacterized protein n=1 Tax=Akanthomyces muscarius TaxID=2231603 RepID=A0A9W8UMA1_AKAMU|nr:hypothetical protein LMH87_009550 [Akanthomyces muscarius]KAJ4153042.1 hypothetical protein LMH87_009550 [Akanthomyces muscarius]
MGLGGNSVQKPRHSRHRSDERVSMSGKPAGAKSEHDRREWTDRVEAPTLNDEYSVFAVKFEEMDNWRAFDGNYMRKVYVEIEIETEGRVRAILLHGRLPVNFESALRASEPVQILDTEGRETTILLYRGMRWVDVERFKDMPAGDNTVNGKTSEKGELLSRHRFQERTRSVVEGCFREARCLLRAQITLLGAGIATKKRDGAVVTL